jgi:3-oxoacyl-[acyl-carrier-protein] synthase III
VAKELKDQVDLSTCWCLDVQNGCPAGIVALALGVDAIRTGQAETVLAVGGDLTSRMVDWFDRNTCLLLGDAASAFVITGENGIADAEVCLSVLSHWEQTDYDSSEIMVMESCISDFSPFYISQKTYDAAKEAVLRVTGQETITAEFSKEDEKRLIEEAQELRRKAFPPDGNSPYLADRYPFFVMAGAEVLEKIRRIVPDCGYLPALRKAGIGLDILEKNGLLQVDKVSEIPSNIKREVLEQLSEHYSLLIPHQANLRGHQNLSAALRVPMNKLYSNITEYANTSAAAAGLALYEALRKPTRYRTIRGDRTEIETPKLEKGQKAVVVSFGSGTNVVFLVVERLA